MTNSDHGLLKTIVTGYRTQKRKYECERKRLKKSERSFTLYEKWHLPNVEAIGNSAKPTQVLVLQQPPKPTVWM
jgi:hypothetical protein